jgi:ATPase subunit of ABC transporter with duplicated ATPase domains
VNEELEWVRSNQKGQQKKGKARMRQYEELVAKQNEFTARATMDSITIPAGPRLGNQVIEINELVKAYDDRVLIDGLTCSIQPGSVVGIVGPNGTGKSTLFRCLTPQLR